MRILNVSAQKPDGTVCHHLYLLSSIVRERIIGAIRRMDPLFGLA